MQAAGSEASGCTEPSSSIVSSAISLETVASETATASAGPSASGVSAAELLHEIEKTDETRKETAPPRKRIGRLTRPIVKARQRGGKVKPGKESRQIVA